MAFIFWHDAVIDMILTIIYPLMWLAGILFLFVAWEIYYELLTMVDPSHDAIFPVMIWGSTSLIVLMLIALVFNTLTR